MTVTGAEDPDSGLRVGLEVHQQLDAGAKLFCSCPTVKSEDLPYSFTRRLRPAYSETGRLDPAAMFEYGRGKDIVYRWSPESACLVDSDEEPPHTVNPEAISATLTISKLLQSQILDEIHVMRKIVIDGSNTSGFQRTAVVGLGGWVSVEGKRVGVQSVTLEEDAARILGSDSESRDFALDRLGIPLVEVALDPVVATPEVVGKVALALGRTLRSTGRVARGLGTIRQDLNVSLNGGSVVEVKGVQKLNLVAKIVAYEESRQRGLMALRDRLLSRGVKKVACDAREVTQIFSRTSSGLISRQTGQGGKVFCVLATELEGLIGWEPTPGIRLGKEIAEVARAEGLGGVIHSDEFERQNISEEEKRALVAEFHAPPRSALVLLTGKGGALERAVASVSRRLAQAIDGVPSETRSATDDGETRYMRPRPGAQRMYPETDIPQFIVTLSLLKAAEAQVPERWEDTVEKYRRKYSLSRDLSMQVYDNGNGALFERLSSHLKLEPSVIASTLVSLPAQLSREGVPDEVFTDGNLEGALRLVDSGVLAKEAVGEVFRLMGRREAGTMEEAVEKMGLTPITAAQLEEMAESVISRNERVVREKGVGSFSVLMGELMKTARGRVDGGLASRVLRKKLDEALATGP